MKILLPTKWETRSLNVESFAVSEEFLDNFDPALLAEAMAKSRAQHGRVFVSARIERSHSIVLPAFRRENFYFVEQTLDPYVTLKDLPKLQQFLRDPAFFVPGKFCERMPRVLRMEREDLAQCARVQQCAAESFADDRFHMDPNCGKAAADARYFNWARDLIADADVAIYVAQLDEQIVGFMARKLDHLMLAGFVPRFSKSGLGEFMWLSTLADMLATGQNHAHTRISVNNVGVLNLYARLGFRFRRPTSVLHYWS